MRSENNEKAAAGPNFPPRTLHNHALRIIRENDDVIACLVKLAAVPVEFAFVKPRIAGGWSDTRRRLNGDDERRGTQHGLEYTTVRLWREQQAATLPRGLD
jgi:hypothetical protein